MIRIGLVVVAVLAAAGCGKKDDAGGGGGGGKFAEFGGMDSARWQGAWVAGRDIRQAWDVKGGDVTTWDGEKEEKQQLIIESGCKVKVKRSLPGGASETYSYSAVWDGDQLYLGMGSAGIKKGDDYLICASSDVYTLKGGKCSKWKEDFMRPGTWKEEPAECSVAGDVFKIPAKDWPVELKIVNNVLLNDQMQGNKAEKAADFAAAKAKVTK
jgi:hypothetical protein